MAAVSWSLEEPRAPGSPGSRAPGSATCRRSSPSTGSSPSRRPCSTSEGEAVIVVVFVYLFPLHRIFNMSTEKIIQRSDFLIQFLDLPSKWRLVVNLSGGQQRYNRMENSIHFIFNTFLLALIIKNKIDKIYIINSRASHFIDDKKYLLSILTKLIPFASPE